MRLRSRKKEGGRGGRRDSFRIENDGNEMVVVKVMRRDNREQ